MGNIRARNDSEKAMKRKTLLYAAWTLLKQMDGQLPTAVQIAQQANVSKGTVYIYFKTKEEIFLSLFLSKLTAWAQDIKTELEKAEQPDIDLFSEILARYPHENQLMMVLGGMLHGVLEKNVSFDTLLNFKIRVSRIVEDSGVLFYGYFPWLPPNHGARFMLTVYNLFGALFQSAASPDPMKQALEKRGIETFVVDLRTDMVNTVRVQLLGLRAMLPDHGP